MKFDLYVATPKVKLCRQAYCMVTGIQERTLRNYMAKIRAGIEGFAFRGRPPGYEDTKTELARCFLMHYAKLHDSIPNATCKGIPEVRQSMPEHGPYHPLPPRPSACRGVTLPPSPCYPTSLSMWLTSGSPRRA